MDYLRVCLRAQHGRKQAEGTDNPYESGTLLFRMTCVFHNLSPVAPSSWYPPRLNGRPITCPVSPVASCVLLGQGKHDFRDFPEHLIHMSCLAARARYAPISGPVGLHDSFSSGGRME